MVCVAVGCGVCEGYGAGHVGAVVEDLESHHSVAAVDFLLHHNLEHINTKLHQNGPVQIVQLRTPFTRCA